MMKKGALLVTGRDPALEREAVHGPRHPTWRTPWRGLPTGMCNPVLNHAKKDGFTLVEVIASVVITAILATLLVTMTGNPLTKSADPVLSLRYAFDLQKVMENIVAFTNGLPALKTNIGAENTSQSNTLFGAYQVVHNRYVIIDSGTEVSGGTNLLKVTVKSAGGDRLTRLFWR